MSATSSSSHRRASPPVMVRHRPVKLPKKPKNPGPAMATTPRPARETTNAATKAKTFQPRVILQRPKVSSFGPNAHLAKEFIPSGLHSTTASASCSNIEKNKDGPIVVALTAPSPETAPFPTRRSNYRLQSGSLSSNWPFESRLRRLPPGLPIRPTPSVEADIFVGMSAKRRPVHIPFIGHHILEHSIQNVPICLSDLLDAGFGFSDPTSKLAFDIHLPTLGLGLYDLLSTSSSAHRSAFPGFERGTNCHVTLIKEDPSLSKTSCPPGLEQSHFSLFPSAMPLSASDTVTLFDDPSTSSSHATTVCSSMSSSPTLSSASTPGGYFHNDGNSVKHRKTGKFVTDRTIFKVCEALEQTLEAQQPTTRRVGTIGGHRLNSWMFADAALCLGAPWSLTDYQPC